MQARWIFRKNAEMYEWCVFRRDFDVDTIAKKIWRVAG